MKTTTCNWDHVRNPIYRKVYHEVKETLGSKFNNSVFDTIAGSFLKENSLSSLTKEYIIKQWPEENAPQEKISQNVLESEDTLSGEISSVIVEYQGKWTRAEVAKKENQDKLFIFTDNTDRDSGNEPVSDESKYAKTYGKGKRYPKHSTSAVIRGLDNTMPISTQRWYHGTYKREKGRWTNADVEEFKKVVHEEIDAIIKEWKTGNYTTIVLPQGGILAETDITDLHGADRTKILAALEEEMKRLYGEVGVPYTSVAEKLEKTEERKKLEEKITARKEAKEERVKAVKWDKYAEEGQGIEISRNFGVENSFGRQFSPEAAVFKEGTVIKIRGEKKREHTFNIGGYSIEAAFQMLRGYSHNPKGSLIDTNGKMVVRVEGKDSPAKSSFLKVETKRKNAATREAIEENEYTQAYKILYREWASQNEDKIQELKKLAKDKILTDKYASSRISPARALAEIIWGTPREYTSERVQTKYDIQRKNAIAATRQINRATIRNTNLAGVRVLPRNENTDEHVAHLVNDENDKGQSTTKNKFILAFPLSKAAMRAGMELFINPFENITDAQQSVNKFIQWIIPNDFLSLPNELRVEGERRNKIRNLLGKGGYKNFTILSDGSPKSILYSRALRYIIDNFKELRERYNPVDIQEFGSAKHNVSVEDFKDENGNRTLLFSPKESAKEGPLDDSSPVKLANAVGGVLFSLSFSDSFKNLDRVQKDRLFKTVAMAVPEGASIILDVPIVIDDELDFYAKLTNIGFTKIGETTVTHSNGNPISVGVFSRNGYVKEMVITQDPYRLDDLEKNLKPNHVYILETNGIEISKIKNNNILPIPTLHDNKSTQASYWNDEEFERFKSYVDSVIEKARTSVDNGLTVVLPKDGIGNGSAALKHYAPKCYQYLKEQLEELKDYGNREAYAKKYLESSTATFEGVEEAPSENVELDPNALQSPRAKLRQTFKDVEIKDFARYIGDEFIRLADLFTEKYINETKEKIAKAKNEKEALRYQLKLNRLLNPKTSTFQTITEMGVKGLMDEIKKNFRQIGEGTLDNDNLGAYSQKYLNAAEDGTFELLFKYAIPFIENYGIRISMSEMKVSQEESEADKNAKAEDTEGANTPEMTWSFNHRLVNPWESLSKNVKKIIGTIPMRDINDLRKKPLLNSIGQTKYWDAQYIYHSIMSRMAEMSLGEIDNFMRIIPFDQLNAKKQKIYPLGMPVFPVLEGMKLQYPWANDLIKKLTGYYNKNIATSAKKTMNSKEIVDSPTAIAELGNVVSQFYSNFCQQFVPYCTMVDDKIIEENKPTGAASMKQAAITNYQGNVRFEGVDMIYNTDGSANSDNIEKNINTLVGLHKLLTDYSGSGWFWKEVKQLKGDLEGESLFDAYDSASPQMKKELKTLVNVLKACGIVMSDYDLFCLALNPKDDSITVFINELRIALEAIKGLPDNEHIFESSYKVRQGEGKEYETPRFYWNNFFRKFGDYVTETEYESSFLVLGKSMYSYTSPSYMSVTMLNLTNPDDDVRQQYIEENFMKYDWFFDKNTGETTDHKGKTIKGTFRNKLLEIFWKGGDALNTKGKTDGLYGTGHDMLCKKKGGVEKEYSDWTPEDIIQLMFRELRFPSNKESGCFIIPVLSDSQVCKVIQADKNLGIPEMRQVVLQELTRMKMVEKRNTVFRMQGIEKKLDAETRERIKELRATNSKKDEEEIIREINRSPKLNAEEKSYYVTNLKLYNKYKSTHPEELQKVENFDDNGSNFCFYPELNNHYVSYDKAQKDNNVFLGQIIRVLSRDINNPNNNTVSFKTVVNILQNMSEDTFNKKATAVGLTVQYAYEETGEEHPMTKEQCLNMFIDNVLEEVMDNKVKDFFYDYSGKINEVILRAILQNNPELNAEYERVWKEETPNSPLSPKDIKAKEEFVQKAYNEAKKFYFAHTAIMSDFIQLMVTDIAYYKDPTKFKGSVDFAKRWKEVYGAGMKLNTNSKFGKKIECGIIIEDRKRRSHSYDVLSSVLQKAVDDGRILEEEKDAVMYKMKGITGTDAQAFRSLTSFRDLMDMLGRYSEEVAQSIDNIKNGIWTMKDFYTVFNTVKPFTFGPEDQDSGIDGIRMRTMVQHKNSEAVLLAIYSTLVGSQENDANYSAKLKGINRAMEEIELVDESGNPMTYANGERMKAIDVVQHHSAVKVGAHGVIDINYSRNKLEAVQKKAQKAIEKGQKEINIEGIKVEVSPTDSYYDIEKKLEDLLDANKISFKEYEAAMDYFEPTAKEVFEIIQSSIYKNGDKSLGYDYQVLHRIPYAYYCVQQPTDDHYTDEEEGTFGSQPRHIIMADLPDNFSITINGKTYNREQIRERYNGLTLANLLECYETEIEPLFKDTTGGKDKRSAARRLRDRLLPIIQTNPKYGKQMEDALSIVPDGKGGETFALPPNNITITSQLEEIITSLFKNAIHQQKINGGNVILAADMGYSNKLKVRGGKRDAEGNLISAEGIEGVECLLPAHLRDMFEPYMIPRKDEDGRTSYILDPEKLKEAGLDKLIGYRIPTEGLYSIMPLIIKGFLPQQSGNSIVVAQEITVLTGSDNDVDKLYLMMKAADKNLEVIKAESADTHPLNMTKEQRDNEIIDIFYGITTSPQMSHLWAKPGNYDNITLNANRLRILKNKALRRKYIRINGLDRFERAEDNTEKNIQLRLIKSLSEADSESLNDFVNDFDKPLSPVYPDTFIEMHQTYMAGVAEKGIFANNTLDHAKLQWANIRINPAYTFTFEGRQISRVDERYVNRKKERKIYRHYISSDCAECSAASVDNGKDPKLCYLNVNKKTATFFGFLLRLGLGIEGASLLMAQPVVNRSIATSGAISVQELKNARTAIKGRLLKLHFDTESDELNWRMHNFTTEELYLNIIDGSLSDLIEKRGDDKVTIERLVSLYNTYSLLLNLKGMEEELKEPKNVLHYDSPTHAADTSLGGVIEQIKAVEEINKRAENAEFERMLLGEDNLLVYNIKERITTKKIKGKGFETLKGISGKQQLYEAFMKTELPITQGFYTLGIESIRTELASHFALGRKEMQKLTDTLWEYMKNMHIYKSEDRRKIITQMYKDWVVYTLSKTSLFGNDGEMTFDQKRQYYLYDFPLKFLKLKETMPELLEIDAIRRMSVRNGMIIMDRGGKTTVTLRDFITDSFDALLQSPNKEMQKVAKDLFMYTYYLNGGDYSYMSFGNMMSTEFQRAFPEFIQALRDMNTIPIDDSDLDNFFNQFILKRGNMGLVPSITFSSNDKRSEALQSGIYDTGKSPDTYGNMDDVPEYVFITAVRGDSLDFTLLQLSKDLTDLYGTVVYLPLKTNTSLHYNASQTPEELAGTVYDQDKINANNRLGRKKKSAEAVNYDKYQSTKSLKETPNDVTANVAEPSEDTEPVTQGKVVDTEEIEYPDLSKAVGIESTEVFDRQVQEREEVRPLMIVDEERLNQDKHIAEAQEIIKENNNGLGLCD